MLSNFLETSLPKISKSSNPSTTCDSTDLVVTDLTITFCSSTDSASTRVLDSQKWHRIEKELYLHTAQQSAWVRIAQAKEEELTTDHLVITDIRVGEPHARAGSDNSWKRRPGGIWVLRSNYTGDGHQAVTGVDVLFGVDAVDPRPQWALMRASLQLNAVGGATSRKTQQDPRPILRAREDGKFKIVQISDTHMVTGVGVCKDAVDANGQPLPETEADPLTVNFLGAVLDVEQPDLVLLTGDQAHHDIPDSQSALFKVVAPLIGRSIPYAAVFGNHDAEGTNALTQQSYTPGMEQMSLLEDLPFSLCQSGPEQVDGVGNYYLQVFAHPPSQLPLLTLYLLDSHGQIPSKVQDPDYDPIKQSQIEWFTCKSKALRKVRVKDDNQHHLHKSLAFMHIPVPEYADTNLIIRGGHRGEPTEGPSFNSHFYDALAKEDIVAVGCGHDHVNDFCGLRPQQRSEELLQDGSKTPQLGPWLCYAGGSGFGGYCSYSETRYHRRTRVWEFDTSNGDLKTWKRVEYASDRIDELVLVEDGVVIAPPDNPDAQEVA
ncbi:Metallo-dependent phosphatase-like protein [Xylariales sp. AK1849]|nr:Metallo-dependent phosphatase-like protein [Xylariales sp. AK1849]